MTGDPAMNDRTTCSAIDETTHDRCSALAIAVVKTKDPTHVPTTDDPVRWLYYRMCEPHTVPSTKLHPDAKGFR